MTESSQDDASFYHMVQKAMTEQPAIAGDERRVHERRSFECLQLLAYFDGSRLPKQSEFSHYLCQDISASGFAFCDNRKPEFHHVVLVLGEIPWQLVCAKVRNVHPTWTNGRAMYRIGCQFEKRLD